MESAPVFTCDGCELVIEGRAGYPRNDMLVLSVGSRPTPQSSFVFSIAMEPMLDHTHHFHDKKCLSAWLAKAQG